jgi:hypothetical protein
MNKLTIHEIDKYEQFMREEELKEEQRVLELLEKEIKKDYQNEIKRMKKLSRNDE